MTEEHKASRTIVKSPPELWAECSVAESLARHLGQFGEIKITRLEPETTVAWEGEHASGTVRLEPSGWGTQVTLTATPVGVPVAVPDPEPLEPEAAEVVEEAAEVVEEGVTEDELVVDQLPRWQVFARLWARLGRKPVAASEAEADTECEPEGAAETDEDVPETSEQQAREQEPGLDHQALLTGALDSLGQAHHRPFSRA
jgi:hypothetical protein